MIPVNVSIFLSLIFIQKTYYYRQFKICGKLKTSESRLTNFNKPFAEITTGLDNFIENLASKTNYNVNNFYKWKIQS